MASKPPVAIILAVVTMSAGLGIVVTSKLVPENDAPEVRLTPPRIAGSSGDLRPSELEKPAPVPEQDRTVVEEPDSEVETSTGLAGNLLDAHIKANESAAIATLRSLAMAQAQIQRNETIDIDEDGQGEYAFLGEIAGTRSLRGPDGAVLPELYPPVLSPSMGEVSTRGLIERSGYYFCVYLPGAPEDGVIPGYAETYYAEPDADQAEQYWCAYAWPVEADVTGRRAFFVSQEGDLAATDNTDGVYSGDSTIPDFDAARSAEFPGDMSAGMTVDNEVGSNDGQAWGFNIF